MSFRDELIDRAIAAAFSVPLDAVTARRFDVGDIERGKFARAVDAICDTVGAEAATRDIGKSHTATFCEYCDKPIDLVPAQLALPLASAAICNKCGGVVRLDCWCTQ